MTPPTRPQFPPRDVDEWTVSEVWERLRQARCEIRLLSVAVGPAFADRGTVAEQLKRVRLL